MKSIITWVALGCLLLTGCQQPTSSSNVHSLSVTSSSTYKYYSLSTGAEVTDSASQDWDIAISSSTGGIRTNSGDTAGTLGSAGAGGVYYAGTDFDTVSSVTVSKFSDDYATDTTRFLSTFIGLDGDNNPMFMVSPANLNQITKLDYSGGDGTTEETAFENDASAGVYDGHAYYSYDEQGNLSVSNEVYVVRHGDGTHYSKIQIVSMTGDSTSRARVIKYENF